MIDRAYRVGISGMPYFYEFFDIDEIIASSMIFRIKPATLNEKYDILQIVTYFEDIIIDRTIG